VPNTPAPGFAEECQQQCKIINASEQTPKGPAEANGWDSVATN